LIVYINREKATSHGAEEMEKPYYTHNENCKYSLNSPNGESAGEEGHICIGIGQYCGE
jgi:hypothetical protein